MTDIATQTAVAAAAEVAPRGITVQNIIIKIGVIEISWEFAFGVSKDVLASVLASITTDMMIVFASGVVLGLGIVGVYFLVHKYGPLIKATLERKLGARVRSFGVRMVPP